MGWLTPQNDVTSRNARDVAFRRHAERWSTSLNASAILERNARHLQALFKTNVRSWNRLKPWIALIVGSATWTCPFNPLKCPDLMQQGDELSPIKANIHHFICRERIQRIKFQTRIISEMTLIKLFSFSRIFLFGFSKKILFILFHLR